MKEWMRWVNEVNDAGPRQEDRAVQDPPNFPFPSICQVCLSKNHFGFWYFLHHVGWIFNIAALSRFDTDDRIWSTFCTGSPWEDISIERAEISCMSSCLFTSSTSFSSFIVYIIWFSSSTSSTSPTSTSLYLSCPSLTPRLLPSFLYNFKAAKKMTKDDKR